MTEEIKKHHHLVTGELVFRVKEAEEVNALRVNAILLTDDGTINVAGLGRAQQALQLQFHKRMQDPNIEVLDVIILNLSPLGFMSEEEFQRPPAGMKQQEMQPANQEATVTSGDALDEALATASSTEQ